MNLGIEQQKALNNETLTRKLKDLGFHLTFVMLILVCLQKRKKEKKEKKKKKKERKKERKHRRFSCRIEASKADSQRTYLEHKRNQRLEGTPESAEEQRG